MSEEPVAPPSPGQLLASPEGPPPIGPLGAVAGTFTDPNALGVGLALMAPLALSALRGAGTAKGGRIAGGLLLLLLLPALEASGSRSGFLLLGVAAVVGLAGLLRARIVRPGAVAAGLAAAVAVPVAAAISL